MKAAPFTYHRVHSVSDAVALLADLGPDAKLIAGGQSLVAMMAFRLARPTDLVDIATVPGLDYLRTESGALCIGALSTHHRVETAVELDIASGYRVIRNAMSWVGHLPIRTRGTVGGSLAHADATAEWCLLAVLLDAELVVHGPAGQRVIGAADFFLGYYTTALDYNELLVEVRFRRPAPHAAVTEFAERLGDFATVSAGVSLDLDGDRVTAGRLAVGGVAPAVIRVAAAERLLAAGDRCGPDLFEAVASAAAAAIEPVDNANGSEHYHRRLNHTLVLDACEKAMGAP